MARYGISRYGESLYGELTSALFSTSLVLENHNYAAIKVSVAKAPGGLYNQFRIVRSNVGEPVFADNGKVVYDTGLQSNGNDADGIILAALAQPGFLVLDTGLTPGRWAYYSAFVYVVEDATTLRGEWVRVDTARLLVPYFYNGAQNIWDRLPTIYKNAFGGPVNDPTYVLNDALGKFIGIFGFQNDILRSLAASAGELHIPDRIAYQALPAAIEDLGTDFEEALGPEQMRRFLKNQAYFYKTKGTLKCARGVAIAVTGLNAEVKLGDNLIWSEDFANAVSTTGTWNCYDGSGWGVVRAPGGGFALQQANNSPASTALVQMGPSTDPLDLHGPDQPTLLSAIPVRAGRTYALGCSHTSAGPVYPVFVWLDNRGHVLETDQEPGSGGAGILGGAAQALAPVNASYLIPAFEFNNLPDATVRFSQVQVNDLGDGAPTPPYEAPRMVHVRLLPKRINLVSNPSFETNVDLWNPVGVEFNWDNTVRDTKYLATAVGSAAITTTTAIDNPATPAFIWTAFPTQPGERYGVRIRNQRTDTQGTDCDIAVVLGDAPDPRTAHTVGSHITGPTEVAFEDTVPFAFFATSRLTYLMLDVRVLAAGAQVNVDNILLEQTNQPADQLLDFFSGGSFSIYDEYFWTGDPENSQSMYFEQRAVRDSRLQEILPRYLPFGTAFDVTYGLPTIHAYLSDEVIVGRLPLNRPVSPVGKDLSAQWANYVHNGRSLTVEYDTVSHSGKTLQFNWSSVSTPSISLTAEWNALQVLGYVPPAVTPNDKIDLGETPHSYAFDGTNFTLTYTDNTGVNHTNNSLGADIEVFNAAGQQIGGSGTSGYRGGAGFTQQFVVPINEPGAAYLRIGISDYTGQINTYLRDYFALPVQGSHVTRQFLWNDTVPGDPTDITLEWEQFTQVGAYLTSEWNVEASPYSQVGADLTSEWDVAASTTTTDTARPFGTGTFGTGPFGR